MIATEGSRRFVLACESLTDFVMHTEMMDEDDLRRMTDHLARQMRMEQDGSALSDLIAAASALVIDTLIELGEEEDDVDG